MFARKICPSLHALQTSGNGTAGEYGFVVRKRGGCKMKEAILLNKMHIYHKGNSFMAQ